MYSTSYGIAGLSGRWLMIIVIASVLLTALAFVFQCVDGMMTTAENLNFLAIVVMCVVLASLWTHAPLWDEQMLAGLAWALLLLPSLGISAWLRYQLRL